MLEKSVERMLRDGIEARVPKARCLKFVTPVLQECLTGLFCFPVRKRCS